MRKNLKKLFCWAMALILILGLIGCQDPPTNEMEKETEPGVIETEAPTEEATEATKDASVEGAAKSIEDECGEDAAPEENVAIAETEPVNEAAPTDAVKDTSSKDSSKNNTGSSSNTGNSNNKASSSAGNSNANTDATGNGNANNNGNTGNSNTGNSNTGNSNGNDNSSESTGNDASSSGSAATPTPPDLEPAGTIPPVDEATTEPAGCSHDWQEVWHPEEGHYSESYVLCRCGARFNSEAEWREHTKAVPGEDLINHTNWCTNKDWIVDSPEYTEWVCSKCGKVKD